MGWGLAPGVGRRACRKMGRAHPMQRVSPASRGDVGAMSPMQSACPYRR